MENTKKMTMKEAGRKGGMSTKQKHGHEYYVSIGKKGGQVIRELIEKAKKYDEGVKA